MHDLFDYVEPADTNLPCYSFRIHALLLRTCIEARRIAKAMLTRDRYTKDARRWNMADYSKINATHRLSSYRVKVPHWSGAQNIRTPFAAWAGRERLPWHEAYNTAKHDRLAGFQQATFAHLLDACCGLLVILSAQFWTRDFRLGTISRIRKRRERRDGERHWRLLPRPLPRRLAGGGSATPSTGTPSRTRLTRSARSTTMPCRSAYGTPWTRAGRRPSDGAGLFYLRHCRVPHRRVCKRGRDGRYL